MSVVCQLKASGREVGPLHILGLWNERWTYDRAGVCWLIEPKEPATETETALLLKEPRDRMSILFESLTEPWPFLPLEPMLSASEKAWCSRPADPRGEAMLHFVVDATVAGSSRVQKNHLIARSDGVRMAGYHCWSLLEYVPSRVLGSLKCLLTRTTFLSNLEWNNGYAPRFGLTFVDRENGCKRVPKDSSKLVAAIWKHAVAS